MIKLPKEIPEHNYKIIIVPSEKIKGLVSDYSEIQTPSKKYKIIQRVTVLRSEPLPSSLMILATGDDFCKAEIFGKYRKSDKLYFFICHEQNTSNTEK